MIVGARKVSSVRSPVHIAHILRERILSGQYSVGEWLPAERLLTADLHVHRNVVRAAIDQLVRDGLLTRQPHCRPIVAATTDAPVALASNRVMPPNLPFPAPEVVSPIAPSRFVTLIMWHGGDLEKGGKAQQRMFWGMNQALAQAGYHGVFLDLGEKVGSEEENAKREAAHLRYALEQGMGGVIFYPYAYQENRALISEVSRRIPVCLLDRMLPGVEADYVGTQNFEGIRAAVHHLVAQGHRRIAYVTKSEPINPVQDRQRGYSQALHEAFPADADEVVLTAPSFRPVPWTLFDTVFQQSPDRRPTAVIAFNDHEAIVVAERLKRLGLLVPLHVALIGFDDIVRILPNGVGLTSVAQPFEEIGRAAAAAFLRRVESPMSAPQHIELPTRLVIRESSGVPSVV